MPRLLHPPTAGALAFRALSVRDDRCTQVRLAASLGTSQQNVSNWQTGRFRPGPIFRRKIEALYGIPQDDWMTREERAALASVTGGPHAA